MSSAGVAPESVFVLVCVAQESVCVAPESACGRKSTVLGCFELTFFLFCLVLVESVPKNAVIKSNQFYSWSRPKSRFLD